MIDTDKYEGHTPAPWRISDCGHGYIDAQNWIGSEETGDGWVQSVAKVSQEDGEQNLVHSNVDTWNANAQLIADAPLLLAEVKRLKKELAYYTDNCTIVWMPDDVLSLDDTLTDEQVSWVLGRMEHKHDACLGISWDTIEFWISEVKKND